MNFQEASQISHNLGGLWEHMYFLHVQKGIIFHKISSLSSNAHIFSECLNEVPNLHVFVAYGL